MTSRNRNTLEGMGDGIVLYLMGAKEILNIGTYCTASGLSLKMNSGFSKIYSLLVDDFIMYDSRVAAALCLLVRRFCEAKGLNEVPGSLKSISQLLVSQIVTRVAESTDSHPRIPPKTIWTAT